MTTDLGWRSQTFWVRADDKIHVPIYHPFQSPYSFYSYFSSDNSKKGRRTKSKPVKKSIMESLEQSKEPKVIGNFPKENVDSGESSQSKTISKEVLSEESASLLEKEKNAKSDKNDNCPGGNVESSHRKDPNGGNEDAVQEFEGKSLRSNKKSKITGKIYLKIVVYLFYHLLVMKRFRIV